MFHTPLPLHSMDAMSHLDLTQHCIPLPIPTTTTTSRPRARQVLNRLKRQASALVKSPTSRLRSASYSQPAVSTPTETPVPTVTLVSTTSPHSSSPSRSRSVSCVSDDDVRSTATATLHIDAPSPGDFVPYLPLATRLERERQIPYFPGDPTSFPNIPAAPPSGKTTKRRFVPPSSPSPSERSDSTASTRSPATPIFPHHMHLDSQPYSPVLSTLYRWSTGSDQQGQKVDPLAKAKAQIVRRSLIQDNFLLACAAASPPPVSPASASGDDGPNPPKKRLSTFKKKSLVSLPPLKPPPSYPLPSPPLVMPSDDSDCSLGKPRDAVLANDEEWTLLLGAPSQPLEFARDTPKKEFARERSGSSPSIYSTKQHLSPEDIPLQIQQHHQPRVRTPSNLSTRSKATTRRIESGPAPNLPALPAIGLVGNEDWTLSLPLLKKTKSSLCVDPTKTQEVEIVAGARKCKSFAEWTSNLPDELDKLRALEREQKRERNSSKISAEISMASNLPQRSVSQVKLKRQLPIGPGPSSPCTPTSPTFSTSIKLTPSRSMISLHSMPSTASMVSTCSHVSASGLRHEQLPLSPTHSTQGLNTASFKSTGNISASTSVSTLGKFPLPPSFSSKLLQRRQAVPPMPKPLLPACAFASTPTTSLSTPLGETTTGSLELPISSAPATTPYFPLTKKFKSKVDPRSRSKGKENQKYFPPSTASSASSSSSNSVRTVSSTATIIPSRRQQQRLIACLDESEDKMVSGSRSEPSHNLKSQSGETPWIGSLDSPLYEGEFDTCTEGGFSLLENLDAGGNAPGMESEMDAISIVSGAYYSARSSLSI